MHFISSISLCENVLGMSSLLVSCSGWFLVRRESPAKLVFSSYVYVYAQGSGISIKYR
jgi:hypothetical protein